LLTVWKLASARISSTGDGKPPSRDAPTAVDVVFLGDEFTQAWTGLSYKRPLVDGSQIVKYFNQTFQKQRGAMLEGIPLGIAEDTVRQKYSSL